MEMSEFFLRRRREHIAISAPPITSPACIEENGFDPPPNQFRFDF